ncbi:DUF389 domain-containing protein [Prevotella sp. HUN102]|uniref:DUF389 domain-containing protein n=1 Tax=Prevotella sp. HUN102 TaxID=1392486 RepID=UPI000491C0CC|nr:DUF389 domain-containing protein [Prevotella sp. HUN102]
MNNTDLTIWQQIKKYFDMSRDQERESAIIQSITSNISFTGANLWILIFAIFLASLGLNVNSTAVIIGAMLISPLMGPILGIGLAIGINDLPLLKRSGKNLFIATAISITTATIYFVLSPYQGVQSELLARTSPNIYDVLIALFGGAAGITAHCAKDKGNVLPGVAIATALMPPLCTAGYGIANGNLAFFAGAFFLYFINTVFITVATFIGVRLMKFRHKEFTDPQRRKVVLRTIAAIVILTMIPAGIMTVKITRESLFNRQLGIYSHDNLTWKGTQIVSQNIVNDTTLRIVAVGNMITDEQIAKAQQEMSKFSRLKGIHLEVIQGMGTDSLLALRTEMGNQISTSNNNVEIIQQQTVELAQLQKNLNKYVKYEQAGSLLKPEMQTLYPEVRSLTLTAATEVPTDTLQPRKYVLAVVKVVNSFRQTDAERKRMTEWLKARVSADSLVLITRRE